ncbi:MAG: tetratricopeptide repeat protein [Treponema sp.]|nr:tetratricopeptide repeat protein [Treponema sp.]
MAFIAVTCFAMVSCGPSYNSIKRMQKMEEGVSNPTTKEELKEALKKYDARALDLVTTQAQEGMWYKILGTRYLDEGMYKEAYEAFKQAVLFFPNNQNLYYYIGICAGYLSNTELDYNATGGLDSATKKMNYLKLAESAYLTSLEIDPKYYRSMYALGVLYVFELKEPESAIPYLERFLEVQKRDTDGMFVLANAYYMISEFDKAIALYDQIIKINPNAQKTSDAQRNKKAVLDAQYASN